jgi:hypothetical protein
MLTLRGSNTRKVLRFLIGNLYKVCNENTGCFNTLLATAAAINLKSFVQNIMQEELTPERTSGVQP